jgi:hypothetical protein
MKLKSVEVDGLFQVFDHRIPLAAADRVTIVHGPNGFGKTVVLQMIASLISGDTAVFEHVPFSEFRLLFDDDSKFVVKKSMDPKGRDAKGHSALTFDRLDAAGSKIASGGKDALGDLPEEILNQIDRHVPGMFHRSENGWRGPGGEFHDVNEILRRYPNAGQALPKRFRKRRSINLSRDLPVFFVETKRLYAEDRHRTQGDTPFEYWVDDEVYVASGSAGRLVRRAQRTSLRVEQYSADIAQRIKSTLADYAKNSQESDRTFPERLVQFFRSNQTGLPEREIVEQMSQLESKRQRLVSLGFLDSEIGLRDLTEDDVRKAPEALTIYVGDVQEKLKVFDDLAQRAGTLIDVLNERFKYKKVKIRRDMGFSVSTDTDAQIALADLSSGEQHELVVLYELLFRAPRNGLVLVDEPEISLHVAWQSRFLQDLIDILKVTDSYAIVATHSPVIIGPRWDLTVELKGPDAAE